MEYAEQGPVRFFLWACTGQGVVGYQQQFCCGENWQTYILKSGPGTGKGRLLAAVRDRLVARGETVQEMICPLDPPALDGLLIPQRGRCVLDGTAPHPLEPRYWEITERLIHLGQAVDVQRVRQHAAGIIAATDACAAAQDQLCRQLAQAAALKQEIKRIVRPCVAAAEVWQQADRLAAREIPPAAGGEEQRRFLSAVTPDGVTTLYSTLQALCPRVIVLQDECGEVSALLTGRLLHRAAEARQPVIACRCTLEPEETPEHILLPGIGTAFTVSNRWHRVDFPVYRRIHAARFTDAERLRKRRQRLSFLRRALRETMDQAVAAAQSIRERHRLLEQTVEQAVDPIESERLMQKIAAEIVLESP
ncbi:MAG: hypothetical protein IKI50_05635 [Clostridia bacterium]|nr:hypothetical protein [Clostridia bacterium]